MDDRQLEAMFGISEEAIARRSEPYETGDWKPGTTTPLGRPALYGSRMKSVTYRDTEDGVAAMDARAQSLGLSRSDYLRNLVRKDLATASQGRRWKLLTTRGLEQRGEPFRLLDQNPLGHASSAGTSSSNVTSLPRGNTKKHRTSASK